MRIKLWPQKESLFWRNYFNIILVSLAQRETGNLYTERRSAWKWEGFARYNISKDGDSKYREVYSFYDGRREWPCNVYNVPPEDRSGRR